MDLNSESNIIDTVDLPCVEENVCDASTSLGLIQSTIKIIDSFLFLLVIIIILIPLFKYSKIKITYKKFNDKKNVENNNENITNESKDLREKIKEAKKKLFICMIIAIPILYFAIALRVIGEIAHKPIIYIYPQEEQTVTVKLEKEDLITCSYPKYEEKWNVLAKPNGDLTDLKTGRKLYALYWEGGEFKNPDYKEGFVIKGEDSAKFLEEKLNILGLNEKEAEEFIIYWLPKMEKNKYNYIKFVSQEEIDDQMPLEIDPKPDTLIRVYMQFKVLPFKIKVKEQELDKVERSGFTVVEWGGSEL